MEQYIARFYELALFSPRMKEDNEEMKDMYVEGLRCSI